MIRLFILFIFLLSLSHANLTITDDVQKNDNFTLKYLYDEDASLIIENIQNSKFQKTIPSQFTQGYKYGDAWFKLELVNQSKNEDFVLYFTESIWSALNLYSKENGVWKVQKNGLNVPLNERSIKDSSPAFSLHLRSGKNETFYIQGSSIASQIGEFQLYTKKEFYNPNRITITEWYIIYAFVLFAFILLNTYNFLMTKEKIYAYYIGYVFIYIVFSFMHSGAYIAFGFPNWQEGLHVLGTLTLFALLQFSIEFLELRTTYPLMKKAFNYLSAVALFFALLLSQNVPYATIASNIFFSLTLILIVYVAIRILKQGFNGAKYYLIALMLYLPSMAIMAMNFNTILPNTDITRYAFLGGAFVEIFFFTLILTNRYMEVNTEKLLAQDALLEEKNNNEQKLILEIDKQTQHLQVANYKLQEQTKELQVVQKQLKKEASTDMLSGLYNRRYFFEASQKSFYTAIRYEQNLSVLMIDIDLFKNINDTYGHVFGDKIIRNIANTLQKEVRDSDILARYGGEEFIILLPHADEEEAINFAERIRKKIESHEVSHDSGDLLTVTVSIGLSQLHDDLEIEQLILKADKALYNAKNTGRNKVCYL